MTLSWIFGKFTFQKILLNDQDLHRCLPASSCKKKANKDIAIVSTRFFLDVKSHRISAEIFRAFSLNEHIDKQLICP